MLRIIEDVAHPVRAGFGNVGFNKSAAVKKVVRHYRRSSTTVSEIGLPLIWMGGRLGRTRFIRTLDELV